MERPKVYSLQLKYYYSPAERQDKKKQPAGLYTRHELAVLVALGVGYFFAIVYNRTQILCVTVNLLSWLKVLSDYILNVHTVII